MSDLVLNNVTSGYNLSLINSNFQAIQDKINNFCLQTSQGDNVMSQDLDMNSHSILNMVTNFSNNGSMLTVGDAKSHFYQIGLVPTTTNDGDAVSYGQVGQMIAASTAGTDPANVALYSVLASNANGQGASKVGIEDAASKFTASTVEGALSETATETQVTSALGNLSGFQQGGTGAISRSFQDKDRESVSVKDFGAKGDGTTDDTSAFQSAINYAETINGCVVRVPYGTYKITATLNIGLLSDRSAIFIGDGPGQESGGGGTNASTTIEWWGAQAAGQAMIKQTGVTVWGISNLALNGRYRPGMTDMSFTPDYGLILDRTRFSKFENVRITGWTRCGLYIQPITSTANDNCSYNQFINLSVSGYHPSGVAIELHGNATTFGGTPLHTSNVCHNTFVQTHIVHAKYGIDIFDADNNSFLMTRIFPRPEATTSPAYGVVLEGSYARSIYFFHLQSGGDMLCKANSTAVIYGYDRENGSNAPTIQAGAKVKWDSFGNNALGEFNSSYYNQVNALVSGDPVLANSNVAEPSLFSIYRGSLGARLSVGVVNSPRSVNIYAHGSAAPSKPAIQFGNDTINLFLLGDRQITSGTAAPTTGSWSRGDVVFNQLPAASGNMGWVCTASGAPGTWKTWGTIGA